MNLLFVGLEDWFEDCDFGIKNNMEEGETYANSICNFFSNGNLELTVGKGESEFFEIKDFEVFLIKFDSYFHLIIKLFLLYFYLQ